MAKTKTKKGPDYITAQLWPLALPIGDLLEDPSNARLHNDRNINAIKSSLQKFGQRKPVVLNKRSGIVLAGNGTLTAARALGWEYLATVIVDDDPATATGFSIADNRTAELAEWDYQSLAMLLESIEEVDYADLGWEDYEVEPLLQADWAPPPISDEDFTRADVAKGDSRTFSGTAEQWAAVDAILKAIGGDKMTALVIVCEAYDGQP